MPVIITVQSTLFSSRGTVAFWWQRSW